MDKIHGRTLEYWKNNAEEDYLKVPISVLKYITCLEERIEQLTIPVVTQRSELFFAVLKWAKQADLDYPNDMMLNDFEKYEANNCG